MKKNDPSLACLNRMKMKLEPWEDQFPREKVIREIVNALRKRYLQEVLHTVCKTITQIHIYQRINNGDYDNHVDLYMDELATMVKIGIKQRSYWRIDPSVYKKTKVYIKYNAPFIDGEINMNHFCEPQPEQKLELGKSNIDPDRIKVKRNPVKGLKPGELLKMQITKYRVFPKRKVMFELASLIRKRYIQEKLASINTNISQVKLFNDIYDGKYDDDVELYIDELTELLKEQIRLRKNWTIGRL
jgi:hypothetical protein